MRSLHPDEKIKDLAERFQLALIQEEPNPNYNAAPSQMLPVVLPSTDGNVLDAYKWGLVPKWSKESKTPYSMINARSETLTEKTSYKKLISSQRCIVPADGFYEWRKEGGKKIPHYIKLKSGDPFAFAGLWENWRDELFTFTIITTGPNSLMEKIHDRMPVILKPEDEAAWLNPENDDLSGILGLLKPYSAAKMEEYEVSTKMNKPSFNEPAAMLPSSDDEPRDEDKVKNSA